MAISENDLLSALEDKTVQKKIIAIVESSKQISAKQLSERENTVRVEEYALIKERNEELELALTEQKEKVEVSKKELSDLVKAYEDLAQKKKNTEEDLNAYKEDNKKLVEALSDKKDELKSRQEQLSEVNAALDKYKHTFESDILLSQLYHELSEKTQGSLRGIFKDTSTQGLVACGIQEKNIANLWDYIKNEVVNGDNADIDRVIKMFDALFERFILAYPMFSFQEVTKGIEFDTQQHIKHNTSKNTSGPIQHVLLRGYVNTNTNKVIKPSVVFL
ncbi:hypothetical protein BZG13_12075 [Salinivibrio sp. ML323]|uniref:hypothetical protein n=1 Tax=Salinivibrio sp. ML323 TaxID=1909474 RepID=UPI000985D21E|nr:hypothetical protein [Salinivibrio sp. ML323]OOE57131.1 hypothetical protein BZG13_12075 [Salinivibrio sp. ML323]